MYQIYKTSDRIRVNIEGLVFVISPLSFEQKSEIQALAVSPDLREGLRAAKLAVKYSLKEIEGVGLDLEFDEQGLNEESIDTVFNMPQNESLAFTCLNLLKAVPQEFINPHTGEALEGVSIVKEKTGKKK